MNLNEPKLIFYPKSVFAKIKKAVIGPPHTK